jgi:spore coat protein CotF
MTTITKDDLLYKDYSWAAYRDDNPHLRGAPDATLLNRKEGYEMLYFINQFCASHSWNPPPATKASAQKVERLIRQHLPSTIRSHAAVDQWLVQNWGQYQ